jgi:hypothetical protein
MKVSQSSRIISMLGVREERRVGEGREKVEGGKINNREIGRLFGAAKNKFCPHHTSAERGQPLLMALVLNKRVSIGME